MSRETFVVMRSVRLLETDCMLSNRFIHFLSIDSEAFLIKSESAVVKA